MKEKLEKARRAIAWLFVGAYLMAVGLTVFKPELHQIVIDLTPPMLIAVGWLFGPAIVGRDK